MTLPIYSADIVIVGGGIAGLWLLSQLKQQGYNTILLEANTLGAGQTILSQGIIHGGTKYAVKQTLTPLARHIKTMPKRWETCLNGQGEIDLHAVKKLAASQTLWIPQQLGGKFIGFLTSSAMQSRAKKIKRPNYPEIFQTTEFNGEVYSLNEPVLDIYSLLQCLRQQYSDCIAKIDQEKTQFIFQQEKLEKIVCEHAEIKAQYFIFTAGQQNEMFAEKFKLEKIKTQRRPLTMLLLKTLSYPLYAHCVDMNFKPRLTITSYPVDNGYAWYIGGEVAEKGAHMTPQDVYEFGMNELRQLFPWLHLKDLNWKTLPIDRAEPWQADGKIPPAPVIEKHHNMLFAWPVKLTCAPLLAQATVDVLQKENLKPNTSSSSTLNSLFPIPEVTTPPWQQEDGWN